MKILAVVVLAVGTVAYAAHQYWSTQTIRGRWRSIYPDVDDPDPTGTTPEAVQQSLRNLRRKRGKED